MLRARVTEYVNTEAPPPEVIVDRWEPYGQCWRSTNPSGYGASERYRCREPAASDLGLCGDHQAELAAC